MEVSKLKITQALTYATIASIIVMIFLVGCNVPTTHPDTPLDLPTSQTTGTYKEISFDPKSALATKTFKSISEFEEFVKGFKSSGYSYGYGFDTFGGAVRNMAEPMVDMAMESSQTGALMEKSASRDYSATNVQVESVDEADLIKTDGNYIYTISDNIVYIIKAYPGEDAEIVSTIEFDDDQPSNIFINGDHLAVFGNIYNLDVFDEIDFRPMSGMTFFEIYDVSDRKEPELLEEYKFEGNYFNARMHGDWVYFVTKSGFNYNIRPHPPIYFDGAVKRSIEISDIHYFDIPYRYPEFVSVHAIDLSDTGKDISSQTVVVEGSQNMYMSEDNIFITYTQYINEWDLQREIMVELMQKYLTTDDKKLIEKIKKTDNDVLSQAEKESKIYQIIQSYVYYLSDDEQEELQDSAEDMLKEKLEEYEYFEFTVVNKINVDRGDIDVKANGKVPGRIINQFSMDEYDGVFRIATTISARWSSIEQKRSDSTNNVYALDKDLDILGKLEGLAEDERIYSTRFMGDRLYMVTFKQIDPFFVIDLSDPKNPKNMGELKIPGFSRYLHPYDKDTIIGIGQDASTMGRTEGLKISLFDVSDVSDPEEIAKFVTDEKYASSNALYEHKAFLFSKEKELLVLPAYSYDWEDRDENYNGAFVFHITKDDIELRGLIDHSGESEYYYGPAVERSLYIEELLYTKSSNLLRINEIDDLHSVKNISLTKKSSKIPIY